MTKEVIEGISGDYEVYDIKARNTARDENCKMFGGSFTTEIKVDQAKIVSNIYRVDENNFATEIAADKWRQLGDGTVSFEFESLGCDRFALIFGGSTQHNFDTYLGAKVVDDEGNVVKGVSLKLGSTNISGTTDAYGQLIYDISSLGDQASAVLTLQDQSKYTVKTAPTLTLSAGKITQVDGQAYSGYAKIVVDALNKNKVLKLRAVDGVGNTVRGVEFKLVNDSALYPDQDVYYFNSPSAEDGVATFTLPDNEDEALKFEGDWFLKTTDSTDKTQSPYALKTDNHSATVEVNSDFISVFSYVDNVDYDGRTAFDIEVVVPATVTYNLGGKGSDNYVMASVGDVLTRPADPTAAGSTFEGWFADSAFTKAFDFTKKISGDTVIYAKWTSNYTIDITDTTNGQTTEGQTSAGTGTSTVLVNGKEYDAATTTLAAGDKISLKVSTQATTTTSAQTTASSVNNVVLFKSASINGVALSASYNKATWTQSNTEWERRMGEKADEVAYDKIKASAQAGLTTSEYIVTGSETAFDIQVQYEECVPVYRLYNMITSEHLFTTQKNEYDSWVATSKIDGDAWVGEGVAWLSKTGGTPVYRLYNAALGAQGQNSHYYTLDANEIKTLTTTHGWVQESLSLSGEVFQSGGDSAIYTCYNQALRSAHHYTSSKTEWEGLAAHGWDLESAKNNSGTGFFKCYMATK